jgi:hypothetical protein
MLGMPKVSIVQYRDSSLCQTPILMNMDQNFIMWKAQAMFLLTLSQGFHTMMCELALSGEELMLLATQRVTTKMSHCIHH